MRTYSLNFIVGMILLLTNQVVGWAGIVGGAYMCKRTGKKIYYALGTGIYVLSWGMVGLGAWLAGPEGIALLKILLKKYFIPTAGTALALLAAGAFYYWKRRNKNNAGV